ncbi:sugar phosphate isomerase/epimerase [Myceligenerans cantabricum]
MRLGYGTNGFGDHPLDAALDVIDGCGYDAVALTLGFPHLDPFDPTADATVARLRDRFARAGTAVVVETGTRYLLDPLRKHHPTLLHPEAEAAPRLDYLRRAVDVAAGLDATCVSFFSGVLPGGVPARTGWSRLLERVAVLLRYAAGRGVPLAIEPEPGMLVETVDDALRLRAELGAGATGLGLTVDVGHCLVVEPDGPAGALRRAAPYLRNVQLDDMPRTHHEHRPFGAGELDLAGVMGVLDEIGYDGVAAVELPRHSHAAPALARDSLRALRAALPDRQGGHA